jgi:hypothetical protein
MCGKRLALVSRDGARELGLPNHIDLLDLPANLSRDFVEFLVVSDFDLDLNV